MANEIPDIPRDMRKVYGRLQRWRGSHARRVPLPDALWAAAGELAREHGINRTAKALHLEYGKLKERAEALGQEKKVVREVQSAMPRHTDSTAAPTFMELITPRPGSAASAVVELEGPRGRMKIELKGVATAELVALSRALWDGEA
ncbi:MAG: hypothetical protein ABSD29_26395 [Verrucomicrobiota bacterium]|jgi:hypothetical protein